METEKMTKQMIDFQKTLFDNSYNTITVIQDHSEKLMYSIMQQLPWVTDAARKPLQDSIKVIKTARDEYKKNIDQGFINLEEVICTSADTCLKKEAKKTDNTVGKKPAGSGQAAPEATKTK